MNPDTKRFEQLMAAAASAAENMEASKRGALDSMAKMRTMIAKLGGNPDVPMALLRPDGSPVPKHWSIFTVGEQVVIKNYTFKVAYIGETAILFEPVGPILLNKYAP